MTTVGGQAVLEGVMMRGPSNWSVAVRKPDGEIAEVHRTIESPMKRHLIARLAIVLAIALFKVTPALITDLLPIHRTGVFVLVEGAIRVTLFVVYLAAISL